MRFVEASQSIAASPQAVFAFLSDLANLPRWQSGVVSAERTSPDPIGIGSTAHVVRELMGQRLAVDLTITRYEPGRRLALESEASGMGIRAAIDLEPAAGGTLVRFGMEIQAQSVFLTPLEGVIAGAAASDVASSLDHVKAAMERA
jgi:carbon monoxide dehydrogenase subunit G